MLVKIGGPDRYERAGLHPDRPGLRHRGGKWAVDDFGGKVLGKPISIIVGDHQLKADIGAGIARRWYDVDQVDLIVDVPVSAVVLAVAEYRQRQEETVQSPPLRR